MTTTVFDINCIVNTMTEIIQTYNRAVNIPQTMFIVIDD
jgi:hypothetical protein